MPKLKRDPATETPEIETVAPPVTEAVATPVVEKAVDDLSAVEPDEEEEGLSLSNMVDGTTSSLATVENGGALETSGPANPFSFESQPKFEQHEIAIPRVRLMQPVSDDVMNGNQTQGTFVIPGYEATKEFNFYPIGMMRRRQRVSEQNIVCKSPDAKHGEGDPGIECAKCPFQQWGPKDPKTGKGTPPECSLIYDYLGVDLDNDTICIMSFQKTSNKTAYWLNGMAGSRDGFGSFAVKFTAQVESGKAGARYYVPKGTLNMVKRSELQEIKSRLFPS